MEDSKLNYEKYFSHVLEYLEMTTKKHFENCRRTDGRTDATPWHKLVGPFRPDELKNICKCVNINKALTCIKEHLKKERKQKYINQVQGLNRMKYFCSMCNSTIEESFANEKD